MKNFLSSWLKFGLFLLPFIIIGYLMENGHFVGASILLAITIFIILVLDEIEMGNHLTSELEWIQSSIFNNDEVDDLKRHADFYSIIHSLIDNKEIKKGMAIKDIGKAIKSHIEQHKKDNFDSLISIYFEKDEKDVKNDTYRFVGYGLRIPTPQLNLYIENGKLVKWKRLALNDYN